MTDTVQPATGRKVRVWHDVCAVDQIVVDRGVAALVGAEPVAIFRLSGADGLPEEWYAVSHVDPFSGAAVMARGLIGSVDAEPMSVPFVASPLHKQRFDLRTGYCLDDERVRLKTYPVEIRDGRVYVASAFIEP